MVVLGDRELGFEGNQEDTETFIQAVLDDANVLAIG
jgi:hypothetical protein